MKKISWQLTICPVILPVKGRVEFNQCKLQLYHIDEELTKNNLAKKLISKSLTCLEKETKKKLSPYLFVTFIKTSSSRKKKNNKENNEYQLTNNELRFQQAAKQQQ